jgi:hypothetical protein
MFDRVRPIDADVAPLARTMKGYQLPEPVRRPCSHCGARVQELRRGRCWGCYQSWAGLRPAGRGARCVVCYERRTDSLRLMEMQGRWLPMCHGCATRTQALPVLPYTIQGLRRALSRDRRGEDRRVGAFDHRMVQVERRAQADRRQPLERTPVPSGEDTGLATLADQADQARSAHAASRGRTRKGELGDFVFELDLEDRDVMDVTGVVEVTPQDKAAMAVDPPTGEASAG